MSYPVVLLVEHALTALDATQIRSLHDHIGDDGDGPVSYHVLIPVDDAAARIEASIGALGPGSVIESPALLLDTVNVDEIRHQCLSEAREELASSLESLTRAGVTATGEIFNVGPIEALKAKVAEVDAREAIVLTQPHVVAEFFHLDWTHQARRALKVPVLHLLEHETFDEQAGQGEGVTGF